MRVREGGVRGGKLGKTRGWEVGDVKENEGRSSSSWGCWVWGTGIRERGEIREGKVRKRRSRGRDRKRRVE